MVSVAPTTVRTTRRTPSLIPEDVIGDIADLAPAHEDVATPEPKAAETETSRKVRFWNGGPGDVQTKFLFIRPNGTSYKKGFSHQGYVVAENEFEEQVLRNALRARAWTDNLPEGVQSMKCTACGWTTRSTDAYQWHANNAHEKQQTVQ